MEAEGDNSSTPAQVGRLLRPRSVAIVGASPDHGSIGANALENLLLAGYRGDIHLVSRSRKEINGRPCVPSIDDLPLGIDAVVLPSPDVSEDEIVDALGSLKGATLLKGMRGAPPSDKRAIAQIAAKLGALMQATPELLDIEINPLVVYPEGALALDALMITAETPGKTG